MQSKTPFFVAAMTAAAFFSSQASAAVLASATTPLNLRSGPGPQYTVIGAIPYGGQATISGCIQGSLWCRVSYRGRLGWAYSEYLTARLSGRSLVVAEDLADIPAATYEAPVTTVGSAAPAPVINGSLIEQPAASEPLLINPPPTVQDYVVSHPVNPVYLNGEVVVGSGLPEGVTLAPIPGYRYDYAYVNRVPVLVEPQTREIAYVYR
jgi:uncharacterized protein YraI